MIVNFNFLTFRVDYIPHPFSKPYVHAPEAWVKPQGPQDHLTSYTKDYPGNLTKQVTSHAIGLLYLYKIPSCLTLQANQSYSSFQLDLYFMIKDDWFREDLPLIIWH